MIIDFRHIATIISILLGIFATSCTEDVYPPQMSDEDSGLTLYIPAISNIKSRSSVEDGNELKYTSLHFFAFPTDGSKPTICSLADVEGSMAFENTYKKFPIKLPRGIYKFYLVANIFNSNTDLNSLPQSEEQFKDAIHKLSEGFICLIPEKGLPMSASHSDFSIKSNDGTLKSMESDGYSYESGGDLYATLTFLYAKITITPKDIYGSPVQIDDVTFENISEQQPILFKDNYNEYGSKHIAVNSDEANISSSYTYYIPERYVDQQSVGQQSFLCFNIGQKQIKLPLGEAENDSEDKTNSLPNIDAHRKIVRGTHYKYVLNTSLDIRLEVSEWSPEKIILEINGPIYLHIEKQDYPITAGTETAIWYKSDVENVYIDSPKYTFGDKEIPLYEYTTEYSSDKEEGVLKVSVNKDIPFSEYDRILQDADKYSYFHIVAGPIHKRIKVTPLMLQHYLNVSPIDVPIDVNLRIASGEYEGKIPVIIDTNYPKISISLSSDSEWGKIFGYNNNNAFLKIQSPDDSEIELDNTSNIDVASMKNIILNILFKGLNSGSDIWKSKRSLKLTIMGIDGENKSTPVAVTINITPLIQDYIIHFKADEWTDPHIYVYQCLEFPADWKGIFEDEILSSKPIGYEYGKDSYFAALEYSFTGAISFHGWDIPVNKEVLYYPNGVPRPFEGYKAQGFYIFDEQDSWNIDKKDQAYIRYNYNMDFCEQYRKEISSDCPQCMSQKNHIWPGIRMKEEGDGWFVFNLTGIATPGKALIMFANGHGGNSYHRYPGEAEVGIPLFDFPSKEGWLYYNGVVTDRVSNQFKAYRP